MMDFVFWQLFVLVCWLISLGPVSFAVPIYTRDFTEGRSPPSLRQGTKSKAPGRHEKILSLHENVSS